MVMDNWIEKAKEACEKWLKKIEVEPPQIREFCEEKSSEAESKAVGYAVRGFINGYRAGANVDKWIPTIEDGLQIQLYDKLILTSTGNIYESYYDYGGWNVNGPSTGDVTHYMDKPTLPPRDNIVYVISAFPGCGKSHMYNKLKNNNDIEVMDSDSSGYSWMCVDGAKVRNPNFPNNYIDHIKYELSKERTTDLLLFVSSHKEVRDNLVNENIPFYLVYPSMSIKDEYIQRYIDRGDNELFVKLLKNNYEDFIRELLDQEGCKHKELHTGEYLEDALREWCLI